MKIILQISILLICTTLIALTPVCNTPFDVQVRRYVLIELDGLQQQLNKLQTTTSASQMKTAYLRARRHYKHVEFFVEYVSPRESKYVINGALVVKHDPDFGKAIIYPQGFQVIEQLLFESDRIDQTLLKKEVVKLTKAFNTLQQYYATVSIKAVDVLEMQQLQLFRIAALNLNGYDATLVKNNVQESDWCMEGMQAIVSFYASVSAEKETYRSLNHQLSQTRKKLQENSSYDNFDRLTFITSCVNPLNHAFVNFHNSCGYTWSDRKQALKLNTGFLFGEESFNIRYFSMYYDDTAHLDLQAQLGKLLFFDPVLSGNNQRSCASCHNPNKGLADGQNKSITIDKEREGLRNTPGLWNVVYQQAFFADGRVAQLEQQVFDVMHNKDEMHTTLSDAAKKLQQSKKYKMLFQKAFEGSKDSSITPYALQKALSEFERTLITWNSPFDRFLKGDEQALTACEVNGYNIFAGKALCGSCHFFPLFNGTVPPSYNDSEFEIIGTASSADQKELDDDVGRYNVFQIEEHRHAFKTPGLRNITGTAPYMHNGAYTTLESVVDFYHAGGGKGLGFSVANQTLPFDSLLLSVKEKEDVILFLKSLTDQTTVIVPPKELPVFGEGNLLNSRKIMGEY
ncbi:MAG: Cytochrome-c peroxidase [Chitinophagaceae bacterium]|nr:Cytochrome-c peroxidase [Chitinophagaceae bacterium]